MIWQEITDQTNFYGWNFLKPLIGHHVFWASIEWHSNTQNLPLGYRYYLIKTEGPNTDWIEKQADLVDGILIVMCLPKDYGRYKNHKNIMFLPCVEWHYQLNGMVSEFGIDVVKNINTKVSILTQRVTYSKAVALAAVIKHICPDEIFYSLHNWIENKNVHSWQDTSDDTVNQYKNLFVENFTQWIHLPDQQLVADQSPYDYHHPAYQTSAINITNESWNYSSQHDLLLPGPFITEKTLKCLLGETAFISNGQFDIYRTLEQFGFEFNYGLDLTYDQTLGDVTRLHQLIKLITSLADIDTNDLFVATRESCKNNKELIVSGQFYRAAEKFNVNSIQQLLKIIH